MRKIPRWAFSSAVLVAVGWAGMQTGFLGEQIEGLAATPQKRAAKVGVGTLPSERSFSERVNVSANSSYRLAIADERPIIESVQATGAVTPVALISVSSQVSGQIEAILSDFNEEVRRGEVIARIDPLSFEIAVEQAEAEVGVARANVLKAEVALRDTEEDLKRKKELATRGTGSQVDEGKAQAQRDLASAQLDDATHVLRRSQAALKQTRTDLDRTLIRSPVDGTVIQRNIEVGQTVAVSLQAPVLYTIAQDLREMQVNASIPESEIGRIRTGQRFEFTADSFPGRIFEGEVMQIRKQPQMTQNVVTYTVVASAPNPELLLLPGMTATARIIIGDNPTRLSVPTAALRFRPPEEPRSAESRVFVERGGRPIAVAVKLGVTDGAFTAVTGEGLKKGDAVITGLAVGADRAQKTEGRKLLGIF